MHINKNIAISETGFVFNPLTGDSYSTNNIGQKILHLLQSDSSKEELIKHFLNNYQIEKETIEKDLTDFLFVLKSYNLLIENDEI